MFSSFEQAKAYIQKNTFQTLDLKFSDLWGRWHHVSIPESEFNAYAASGYTGYFLESNKKAHTYNNKHNNVEW